VADVPLLEALVDGPVGFIFEEEFAGWGPESGVLWEIQSVHIEYNHIQMCTVISVNGAVHN
jgi:hypothetical protein